MSKRLVRAIFFVGMAAIYLLTACKPAPPPPSPTPTVEPTPTPIPLDEWIQEGDTLLRRSDFAGAEAAYQRAIAAQADYAPAYISLSYVYRWLPGRDHDALSQAQKAVELAPDSAAAFAALASAYINKYAPTEAVKAGEQAVKLDEKSATAQAALARAYLFDRQYDAAQKAVEQALTLAPTSAEVYYVLGHVHKAIADFSRARAAMEQAIRLEPDFAPWYIALGDLMAEGEQYDQAMATYQKALELSSDYVPAMLGQAYVEVQRKHYQEAEQHLQRALQLAPHAAEVYVAWGYMYSNQEEYDQALKQFQQALAEDADSWYAQSAIGEVHLRREECDRASSQYQDLIKNQPRFAEGQIGMGFVRICENDATKSLEYFRKAATLEPYNASAQVGLGIAYALQQRWEDATTAYVKALRLSALGSGLHVYLGRALSMQNDIEAAKEEYQVALRLNPYLVEAHVGLGYLLLFEDENKQAQQHARQALALQEKNKQARWILGAALITEGKAEEGVTIMKQVLEEDAENASAHFYLGLAYRDLQKYSQAKKELDTYKALNPQASSDYRLTYLIKVLEQGYQIEEEQAVADLTELLETYMGQKLTIKIESVDGKRTLVVSTAAPTDPKKLMTYVGNVAGGAAFYVPRITPPVENGLLARFEKSGRTEFTVRASPDTMKKYIDGLLEAQQFVGRLQFSREVAKELASVDEIKQNLATTRKLDPQTPVTYKLLSPEEMQQQVATMIQTSQQEVQTDEAFLSLLGIITPGLNLADTVNNLYAEQVAGFYDSKTKTLYVRQGKEQTAMDQILIAHEYAHALQDQHFDLDEITRSCTNADQCRAYRALIEGDATLTSYLYASEHIPIIDRLDFSSRAGGLEPRALEATPGFIRGLFTFPYQEGLTFVSALYDSSKWGGIDKAYKNLPQSTEQILHPERYREGDKPRTVALPLMPAGWHEMDSNVLGELGLRLAWAKAMGPGAATEAAKGWGGDRYALFRQDSTGPYVLVIRTYWDDQNEADEFGSLYRVWMTHRGGYTEEVTNLVGPVQSHLWLSEEGCVFIQQQGQYIILILGPDKQTVEQFGAALSSP